MGLNILNPDHTTDMYLCLLTELFIIQQICTKCLLCARHCGRRRAYDGKQHRHSLHPRGVEFTWVSMCNRHHEVRWKACGQHNATWPFNPSLTSPTPKSSHTQKRSLCEFTFPMLDMRWRGDAESRGKALDLTETPDLKEEKQVAFPHPFQAPYSMLPWR